MNPEVLPQEGTGPSRKEPVALVIASIVLALLLSAAAFRNRGRFPPDALHEPHRIGLELEALFPPSIRAERGVSEELEPGTPDREIGNGTSTSDDGVETRRRSLEIPASADHESDRRSLPWENPLLAIEILSLGVWLAVWAGGASSSLAGAVGVLVVTHPLATLGTSITIQSPSTMVQGIALCGLGLVGLGISPGRTILGTIGVLVGLAVAWIDPLAWALPLAWLIAGRLPRGSPARLGTTILAIVGLLTGAILTFESDQNLTSSGAGFARPLGKTVDFQLSELIVGCVDTGRVGKDPGRKNPERIGLVNRPESTSPASNLTALAAIASALILGLAPVTSRIGVIWTWTAIWILVAQQPLLTELYQWSDLLPAACGLALILAGLLTPFRSNAFLAIPILGCAAWFHTQARSAIEIRQDPFLFVHKVAQRYPENIQLSRAVLDGRIRKGEIRRVLETVRADRNMTAIRREEIERAILLESGLIGRVASETETILNAAARNRGTPSVPERALRSQDTQIPPRSTPIRWNNVLDNRPMLVRTIPQVIAWRCRHNQLDRARGLIGELPHALQGSTEDLALAQAIFTGYSQNPTGCDKVVTLAVARGLERGLATIGRLACEPSNVPQALPAGDLRADVLFAWLDHVLTLTHDPAHRLSVEICDRLEENHPLSRTVVGLVRALTERSGQSGPSGPSPSITRALAEGLKPQDLPHPELRRLLSSGDKH